jgi:hypothetical protein
MSTSQGTASDFRAKWESRPERQAKTWQDTWTFWIVLGDYYKNPVSIEGA